MDFEKIQVQLNSALRERNRIFPLRRKENDTRVESALDEFVNKVNRVSDKQFAVDSSLESQAQSVLDSPLFLCGPMKSGTTLLLELLDGHPELIVLPGDSFFWAQIRNENPPPQSLLHASWDNWLKRMVNPTGQAPFWTFGERVQPYIAFRRLLQYFYDQFPDTWRSSVVSVMLSFFCTNPARPHSPKMWVEKTPGNEFQLDRIVKNFPGARFIHIVRDPRENMASLKKLYSTRQWPWDPYDTARTIGASCRLAVENQERIGAERYHILTYEVLTEEPEKRMRAVADFLAIGWDDLLLRPTVNGVPAHANSMYDDGRSTGVVRKATQGKWRSVLTRAEQRAALGTLPEAKKMGYEWQSTLSDSVLLTLDKGRAKVRRSLMMRK